MKKVVLVFVLFLIALTCSAQKDAAFSVNFKYATTKWGCVEININISYYPRYNTFILDSDEADAISRYSILNFKETRETVKITTEGGRFEFLKGKKGEFVNCMYVSSDLDMKIIYSDVKMKPITEDNLVSKK